MFSNRFEYFRPTSISEALSLLSKYQDDAKPLAGGQSLVSMMKLRLANPKYVVDLGGIDSLNYIREEEVEEKNYIAIGAMTTYSQIKESALLRSKCPLLPKTASVVGDVQVRNRGTIGGSLAHADPAGDIPAAILALRGDLKTEGPQGDRWIKAEDFFLGMYSTALLPDEILKEIRVPVADLQRSAYLKAARRPSDFAIVGVAVCLMVSAQGICTEVSIGVTGISDKPFRAFESEAILKGNRLCPELIGRAGNLVTQGLDVNANIHASEHFRSHLATVYFSRAVEMASRTDHV